MFRWIADNAVTIAASAAVLGVIAAAVFALVRERRGRSGGCTGNCASCPMCCCGGKKK